MLKKYVLKLTNTIGTVDYLKRRSSTPTEVIRQQHQQQQQQDDLLQRDHVHRLPSAQKGASKFSRTGRKCLRRRFSSISSADSGILEEIDQEDELQAQLQQRQEQHQLRLQEEQQQHDSALTTPTSEEVGGESTTENTVETAQPPSPGAGVTLDTSSLLAVPVAQIIISTAFAELRSTLLFYPLVYLPAARWHLTAPLVVRLLIDWLSFHVGGEMKKMQRHRLYRLCVVLVSSPLSRCKS